MEVRKGFKKVRRPMLKRVLSMSRMDFLLCGNFQIVSSPQSSSQLINKNPPIPTLFHYSNQGHTRHYFSAPPSSDSDLGSDLRGQKKLQNEREHHSSGFKNEFTWSRYNVCQKTCLNLKKYRETSYRKMRKKIVLIIFSSSSIHNLFFFFLWGRGRKVEEQPKVYDAK